MIYLIFTAMFFSAATIGMAVERQQFNWVVAVQIVNFIIQCLIIRGKL